MKAALHKPVLYFAQGYWRVRRAPGAWNKLRFADQDRITAAHQHALKLNKTDEAEAMRDAYYKRLAAEKRLAKRSGPQYKAEIMGSLFSHRLQR